MALNSLYSMIGNVGNAVPNQSPTQTVEDPMQMLAPLMKGLEGAGAGNRQTADRYRQQARDTSQQAYEMQAPGPVSPAFRTTDAIGLALLAAMSGRHFDKALAGYLGAKNQKAEQDTQAALQSFGMKQKAMLSQANNYGGMADDADRQASHAEDLAQRQFGTAATFLSSRMNNANTVSGANSRAALGGFVGLKKANIGADAKIEAAKIKSESDIARDKAKMFGTLAKQTPEGRKTWARANGYTEAQAEAIGSMSPAELLAQGRAAKIPYEIKDLQSRTKVNGERAKQIVEATRFIGPSFKLKQQQLALNVENVHNLMKMRKAGIEIRKDMLAKGASSMNQAMRSSAYLLKTAQDEIKKLTEIGNLTDAQKARLEELYSSVEKNQGIIDELNVAQGFLDPVDPNQLFGGIMGEVTPLAVSPKGEAGPFTKAGPIGGGQKASTKPIKVKASRPGLKITNIRVSG